LAPESRASDQLAMPVKEDIVRRALLVLIGGICAVALGIQVLGASGTQPPAASSATQQLSATGQGLPSAKLSAASFVQTLALRSMDSIRLVTAPTIDGDFSDWPIGAGTDVDRYTAFSFQGQISSPEDLSAVMRSGWNESALYFAISVNDDILVTDSPEVWHDDGVEVALDGLYDRYAWGTDDHQYTVVFDGRITDRSVATTNITAGIQQRQGGYNIEIAIPMSQLLPGIPISGTVMGFTMGMHDDDDGGTWDAYLIWEGTNTSSSADEFGSLVFTQRLEDRIAALEARIAQLEVRTRELLLILSEFEQLPPP
jgi:hypothetical protein